MSDLTLKQLREFLDNAESGASREAAMQDMLNENSQAMAEILEMLGKQGPAIADALAKAMAGLSFDMPAPEVKVNVPAPVVNLPQRPPVKRWDFEPEYLPNGALKCLSATPRY